MLFQAFESTCESGSFTRRVLHQTNSLINIFESLKNDPACQDLSPLYQELISAQRQLEFYTLGFEDEEQEALEEYYRRLSRALVNADNPSIQATIATELGAIEVEILRTPYTTQQRQNLSRVRAAEDLAIYVESLGSTIARLSTTCFYGKQIVPLQVASQLMAISGGFFNAELNLALTLAGRLFAGFLDWIKNAGIERKIRSYRETNMISGLTCALQSLQKSICEIEDRRNLVDFVRRYRSAPTVDPAWKGYELMTRELNTFLDFIRRVEASSKAATTQQGNQRADYRLTEGAVLAAVERLSGAVGQARLELNEIRNDHKARRNTLQALIDNLAGYIMQSDTLFGVVPSNDRNRLLLWLRIGDPSPRRVDGTGKTLEAYEIIAELDAESGPLTEQDVLRTGDLNQLERNLDEIIQQGQVRLGIQRRVTIYADPQGALSFWISRNSNGNSPQTIVRRFLEYFNEVQTRWSANPDWFESAFAQRDALALLEDTTHQLFEVQTVLERSTDEILEELRQEFPEGVFKARDAWYYKVDHIYQVLGLREREQLIFERLNQIVQLDLERQLQKGLLSDKASLDTVIRLSRDSLLSSLYGGTIPGQREYNDLDQAQWVAQKNLADFFNSFAPSIEKSLDILDEQIKVFQEPNDIFGGQRPFYQQKATLCLLARSDPAILSRTNLLRRCEGVRLNIRTLLPSDFPHPYEFSRQEIAASPPMNRLCSYRRLQNEVELVEDILRQRPQRFLKGHADELVDQLQLEPMPIEIP